MKFNVAPLLKFFALVKAWWTNPYRGADRWNPNRSHVPGQAQDARFDITAATRLELVHKARDFERNNAIVNRLADLFEQFTVGACGLQVLPDSENEDWNAAAQTWWEEWQQYCDLTSLLSFGTIQSLAARSWFIDGEVFILKTRGESNRPRIQLIESHRVETPNHLISLEGKTIIDGIEINPIGRPMAYWVKDGVSDPLMPAVYRRIPADQMIHIYEPSRPGQMRGLSFLYPVMNDLVDLEDLQGLEMKAAKDAAEVSNILTNEAGEFDPSMLRRSRDPVTTQTSTGTEITEQRIAHYKTVIGARTIALKRGEKLEQFRSERPSVASRDYWDYITSKICAGVGISQLLVFPRSMQGTVARAELDIANAFFRSRSAVFADAMERLYVWVMEWAVRFDKRLDGAPADWFRVDIRSPRSVNVDVGRNSSAMLAELEAGATTYRAIYAPLGLNEKSELRQRAREEAFIDRVAREEGTTPDRIRQSIGESLKLKMAEESKQQKDADDEPVLTT
jgi:lambda family phage portal protein